MDGLKTYIACIVMALLGGSEWAGLSSIFPADAGPMVIGYSATLAALRHGIAKVGR